MINPVIIGDCTLYHGDNRDVLKQLPDNSIDSVCTDPPYALVSIQKRFANSPRSETTENTETPFGRTGRGFMGQKWDTGETAFSEEFWREVLRVLKPGGHLAAFSASRTYHRMACAIEDAGFEIRDSLMWVYGTGFPKSHDVSKGIDKAVGAEREVIGERKKLQSYGANEVYGDGPDKGGVQLITAPATDAAREWEGWGTALKPAFEPIVLARKPLSEGTVAANVLRWRTGALNIDGCRVNPGERVSGGGNGKANHGGQFAGEYRGERPLVEAHSLGRWPANVVHDGSNEVIAAFPNTNAAKAGKPRKGKSGDGYGMTHTGAEYNDSGGSAARFFYSAKASKADRNGSKHPTVKPISLMEWLCTLITPPGGTVLDPFAGSGTTGIAAVNKGYNVVLCEREAEYVEDIKRRMSVAPAVAEQHAANDNVQADMFANDNAPTPAAGKTAC